MEHRPYVVPGIALGVRTTPCQRVERLKELAVLSSAPEESGGGVPQVAVVVQRAGKHLFIKPVACLPCQGVGAPVIIRILKRLRNRSVRLRERHISQSVVLMPSRTAVGTAHRTLVESLVGIALEHGVYRHRAYALGKSVCKERYGVVAQHASRLSGARPCGKPSQLLLLHVEHSLHVASLLSGVQNVGKRELRAEGIPKTVVGIHISVVYLTVVRAVIIRFAIPVKVVITAREQVGAEQTRIEGAHVLIGAALHAHTVEEIVPHLEAARLCRLERAVASELAFKVKLRLSVAYVRRRCLCLHLAAGTELDVHTRALALGVGLAAEGTVVLVLPRAVVGKSLVELHHKVAAEVLRMVHKAVVAHPSAYLTPLCVYLHLAGVGIAVYHKKCVLPLGVRETQMHAPVGGSHLGGYAIVERHLIIMRTSHLVVVTEL